MSTPQYFRAHLREEPTSMGVMFLTAWRKLRNATSELVLGDRNQLGRRIIFLLGVGLANAVAIEGMLFGVAPYAQGSLHCTVAAAIFGLIGTFWKDPRVTQISVLGLGGCIVLSMYPLIGESASTSILAAVSLVSFWTCLFLPIYWNLGIWGLAGGAIYSGGGRLTANTLHVQDPNSYPLVAAVAYMFVPLAIGALLRRDENARHVALEANIQGLSGEREQLRVAFAQKTQELENSRQALVEAERHQTTGRIASGLAHELNNILTPIHGLAELLVQNPHSARTERYAQSILHSAQSASMMTQALLTYTRQGQFDPLVLESSQLFSHLILPELNSMVPSEIQLHTDVASGMHLNVDRRLILQSVWHLMRNAIDAMPQGGVLMLSLHPYQDPRMGELPMTSEDATWARITVADTGEGIHPENLGRVFDPFFTTKTFGVGSGLGLALVHGAITQHGGKISLESEPGRGTRIHLDLPVVKGHAAPLDDDPTSLYLPTKASVLVVSPDQDLRDELEELLAEGGFPVHCLEHPEDMLAELPLNSPPSPDPRWKARTWILDAKLAPQGPGPALMPLLQAAEGPRVLVLAQGELREVWEPRVQSDRVTFARPPLRAELLEAFLRPTAPA